MALSDKDADALGRLLDNLEAMKVQGLPPDEAGLQCMLAGPMQPACQDGCGGFEVVSAALANTINQAQPGTGRLHTGALFVSSLCTLLVSLGFPCSHLLEPDAALALSSKPRVRHAVLDFLCGEAAAARMISSSGSGGGAADGLARVARGLGVNTASAASIADLGKLLEEELARSLEKLPADYLGGEVLLDRATVRGVAMSV
jgi:hypothetical protein